MRFIKLAAAACALLLITGLAFEQLGRARDRATFPRIGTTYDVGGRSFNLNCVGATTPTVIFDSGANDPGYAWSIIQAQVATFARACWWDRAGFGWSDPGPYPMTVNAIARDMHHVLQAAGVSGPLVLVGDSFGGFVVRVYNGLYPGDVAGMVLVDAAHEDAGAYIPDWGRARMPPIPELLRYPVYLGTKALALTGVSRVLQLPRAFAAPGWTPEQVRVLTHLRARPDTVAASASTGLVTDENEREARAAGGLGSKPLVVLTAGQPLPVPAKLAVSAADYQEVWKHRLQPQLAALSSRGRQVIVENAGHGMMFSMPDVVIQAIREVVHESRR